MLIIDQAYKKYPWLLDWPSRFSRITFAQQETEDQDEEDDGDGKDGNH